MPKFIKDFEGVANGEVYPRAFKPGDDCPPELEAAAIQAESIAPAPKPAKAKG
jgi:hypothetical protein